MDNQSILEIVLKARDEASKTIEGMGKQIDETAKKTLSMSDAFKVAGGVMLGVGIAGVGILKNLADAAEQHQVAMASVDTTLRNVASSMDVTTEAVTAQSGAVGTNKKAIQGQIAALQLQKQQLELNNQETTKSVTTTTGHGATLKEHTKTIHENADATKKQVEAIDQQIINLKQSELGLGKSAAAGAVATTINTSLAVSYQTLKTATTEIADKYLSLGFAENETSLAFAQSVRVTKNLENAHTMLATAADLARLKHLSLDDATTALTRAYEGQTRILKGLGIEVDKGAKGMDVLNKVAGATGGQAVAFSKTYEGASQVLAVNFDKLKETLGERLLPSLSQFMLSLVGLIEKLNHLSPATYDTIVNVLKFGTAFALIAGPILLFLGFLPSIIAGVGFVAGAFLPLTLIFGGLAIAAYLLFTHWQQITGAFAAAKPVVDVLFKSLQQFWNEVQPQLVKLMQIISGFINTATAAIRNFIASNKDTFIAFWEVIKGVFTFALGFIQGFWQTTWQAIADYLSAIWMIMKGIIEVAWGIITIFIDIAMGIFTGNWTKAWEGIKKGFGFIWQGIKDIVLGVVDEIIASVKLALDSVTGFINGVISGANSVMSKIPGNHLQIPLIPKFEQGGYVPSTGLAVLHAGEFVLSKDMLAGKQGVPQQISNSTNNNMPINIYATINETLDMNLLGNKIAFAIRNSR